MKFAKPRCPKCDSLAKGYIEKVEITTRLQWDNEEAEFFGANDIHWDNSEEVTNEEGHLQMICSCGNEWHSEKL